MGPSRILRFIFGDRSQKDAPSVGFYVDGIPYFETSAFDIDLSDISSIEVLRGPQGTLYGRNSIGGTINVYTHSPLDYQGTYFRLGYGSYNDMRLIASNYTKVNEQLGLSFSGNYHHNDGFLPICIPIKRQINLITEPDESGSHGNPQPIGLPAS